MIEILIKNNIPHFIIKYYEFSFISDHRNYKYEVFIFKSQITDTGIKKTWYKEPFYPNLVYRKIKGFDVDFFRENENLYKQTENNKQGKVFLPKGMFFDYQLARSVT